MAGRKQGQHGLKVRECRGGKGEKISPSWEKGKYPEQVEFIDSLSDESGLAVEKIMQGLQLVQDIEAGHIVVMEKAEHDEFDVTYKIVHEVHTYMREIRAILEGVTFAPTGEIETIAPESQEKMCAMKKMAGRLVS